MEELLLMRLQPATIHRPWVDVSIPWPCPTKPHDTTFRVTVHRARCPHGGEPVCYACATEYRNALELDHDDRCTHKYYCGCDRRLTQRSLDAIPHLLWPGAARNASKPHSGVTATEVTTCVVAPVVDARDADRDFVPLLRDALSTQYPARWLTRARGLPEGRYWYELRPSTAPPGGRPSPTGALDDTTWRLMDTRSGAPAALHVYASSFLERVRGVVDAEARKDLTECPHVQPKRSKHPRKR